MKTKSESGMAHIILLLLVMGIVAVAVLAGVRVMERENAGEESSSVPLASSKTTAPETIKNNTDLDKTKAALNQTDVDSDVNPDSLNADIDSVL